MSKRSGEVKVSASAESAKEGIESLKGGFNFTREYAQRVMGSLSTNYQLECR